MSRLDCFILGFVIGWALGNFWSDWVYKTRSFSKNK